MERIRVLLADDHTLFRKGIRNMLEEMPDVEVVGIPPDGWIPATHEFDGRATQCFGAQVVPLPSEDSREIAGGCDELAGIDPRHPLEANQGVAEQHLRAGEISPRG